MAKTQDQTDALDRVDLGVIDQLKALKRDSDVLRERLRSLEAMKAEFAAAVYQRVHADYSQRLAVLDAQAKPLRQQARQSWAQLRGALADIDAAHETVKLDRQEIDLRHKLGEFDDADYAKRTQAIEAALAERGAAHEKAQGLRARFLEVFASEDELSDAPAGAGTTQEMPAVAVPGGTQEMPLIDEAALARVPNFGTSAKAPATAQTQILRVLDMPEPPRVPVAAAPETPPSAAAASFGPNATMFFRTARLVPQNPEAGRAAVPLPPKPVVLGADATTDIRVGGPGVEGRHAQITATPDGYTLLDLGSKHGTRVNAEAIQERVLKHEDVIQIGAARFVFREG